MLGWIEICLLTGAAALLVFRALPYFRSYRALFSGGGVLLLITALFPRTGNPIGEFLFGTAAGGLRLPRELFGIVWWVLGAWLLKSLLDLVLRRTFFPDNGEPHPRRLYADLASGLIYILALVGIVGTVFKEPVSTFLATSGVLAIVLGLALQNTLGDVLAGLAINIERPFGTGDWITLTDAVSGQVMQVNWRATRLRTWAHDMVVIPNSVITKGIVTNHSRPKGPHRCIIRLRVDLAVAPSRVIEALTAAAKDSPGVAHRPASLRTRILGLPRGLRARLRDRELRADPWREVRNVEPNSGCLSRSRHPYWRTCDGCADHSAGRSRCRQRHAGPRRPARNGRTLMK